MTQYLLSVYTDFDALPNLDDMQETFAAVDRFNADLQASDAWVYGNGLEHSNRAVVVTAQAHETLITDGPFSEVKEQLGGFWIINAANRDDAIEWAKRASAACRNPVEVRPFQADPNE